MQQVKDSSYIFVLIFLHIDYIVIKSIIQMMYY